MLSNGEWALENPNRKWVSAALLSILIPISLLATSRFTGILREPLTPKVTEAETANWSMARPTGDRHIDEKVTCLFAGNGIKAEFSVTIHEYEEDSSSLPFDGSDGLIIRVTTIANISHGFIHSASLRFVDYGDESLVDVYADPDTWKLQNVEIDRIVDRQAQTYVGILPVGRPQYCLAEISSFWVFFDLNSVNHQMTIALDVFRWSGLPESGLANPSGGQRHLKKLLIGLKLVCLLTLSSMTFCIPVAWVLDWSARIRYM